MVLNCHFLTGENFALVLFPVVFLEERGKIGSDFTLFIPLFGYIVC